VFPGLGANARRIADSLSIPNETVRRKVTELLDAGWLVRESGKLYFTALADQQLAPARELIEALAIENYQTIAALLSIRKNSNRGGVDPKTKPDAGDQRLTLRGPKW
jgi:DNA-binding Lrp family transcriptional regulator